MDVQLPTRILTLTAALALAAPSTAPARWSSLDARTALELAAKAAEAPETHGRLESQRAGVLDALAPLSEAERATLADAERASSGLEEQRGGDVHFTDREVKIILWTAAIIAVVLLIA
jgi:hypothetical protein